MCSKVIGITLILAASTASPAYMMAAEQDSAPQQPSFRSMASAAVNDLLTHFWVGDAETGHIVDTYGGFGGQLKPPDEQGILWERATLIAALEDYHEVTKDPKIR